MFNPYQQYQFGNEQYYPSAAASQQYPAPATAPSFNCDMNSAYAYQQPGPSSGQYCPPRFYPPQAATVYNGSPASMPSYSPQAPSSMYPAAADSGYYGYGTFAPTFAFNGAVQSAQPPVSSSTPVAPAKSMQLYLNDRAGISIYLLFLKRITIGYLDWAKWNSTNSSRLWVKTVGSLLSKYSAKMSMKSELITVIVFPLLPVLF